MIIFGTSTFDEKYFLFDLNFVALEPSKKMVDKAKMSRNGGKCILIYYFFFLFLLSKMIYEKMKDQDNNL